MTLHLKEKKYSPFSSVPICFQCSPSCFLVLSIHTVISCILPAIQIAVFANFINCIADVFYQRVDFHFLYIYILQVISVVGYQKIMPRLMDFVWLKLQMKVSEIYGMEMIRKNAALKYHYHENAQSMDLISRVTDSCEESMVNMLRTLANALQLSVQVISIVAYIFAQSGWVALIILVITIPTFALAMKVGKNNYDLQKEVTRCKRRYEYLSSILHDRGSAGEKTLFGYTRRINDEWNQKYDAFRKKDHQNWMHNNVMTEAGSIITTALSIVVILLLLIPLLNGSMNIGLFMSMVIYILDLIEVMSFSFKDIVGQLTYHREYARELTLFMAMKEEDGALEKPDLGIRLQSLEFRNVSFRYPSGDHDIIKNMSFQIESGHHYAFVGVNGAGKTTIIKLITGLYRDYEGEILLNGRELRAYSVDQLKGLCAVVYQDFAQYNITLGENIAVGAAEACSAEDIRAAAKYARLDSVVAELSNGMDTPLGRTQEKGQELSGGQWQRVAIARAIVKRNALQILDEPTSAMDPLMENKLYEDFANISNGKTTIFISHRLGSTKLADTIFVLSDGKIAEEGSHSSLMARKGIYYEMYASQRKWYE